MRMDWRDSFPSNKALAMAMAMAVCELPVIDFSKEGMKAGSITWELTCQHVRKALEEYGCFKATLDDRITHDLYAALFSCLEEMFLLPKDAKRRYTSDIPFDGYLSDTPPTPLLEAMGVTDPLLFHNIQKLARALWPQGHEPFSKTLHAYATHVAELEKMVRKMIFQSYGVEAEMEETTIKYSMRVMKYGAGEDAMGSVTHFDKNLITILQADWEGLQVYTKGGHWIKDTPSASTFIVMIGESFHGWSNGRMQCPLHRVRLSGSKWRHSVGLFASKVGAIDIPSEVVDEQHPLLFKPFDQPALLNVFVQQIMDKAFTGDDDTIVPVVQSHYSTIPT